ncbi:group-specific protein [Metabacillus fastidiosus]|uniref:group-specific protein n=1 Tax=Metabacillus fastidiosus TaxID=1458 RepID=UPI0008242EFB|nr:group-specific protein [Metabacillus fastidiosus]MED4461822.1 group-specific protein [Metabacillus fastidiosus]
MIAIQLDKNEIEQRFLEELRKHLDAIESRILFWDMKELCRQTNMSEPFVKEQFFYDPRFPKYKVGRKWVIPAREAEKFLMQWLSEQSTY